MVAAALVCTVAFAMSMMFSMVHLKAVVPFMAVTFSVMMSIVSGVGVSFMSAASVLFVMTTVFPMMAVTGVSVTFSGVAVFTVSAAALMSAVLTMRVAFAVMSMMTGMTMVSVALAVTFAVVSGVTVMPMPLARLCTMPFSMMAVVVFAAMVATASAGCGVVRVGSEVCFQGADQLIKQGGEGFLFFL